jgi:hypothetical protein
VASVWKPVKFKTMHYDPLLARVNAFSAVPDAEKEQIRSMHKQYTLTVEMATRQMNLIAAFVAQSELSSAGVGTRRAP